MSKAARQTRPRLAGPPAGRGRGGQARRLNGGFTLIDLLIALPLLAVVAYIALPLVRWSTTSARATGAAMAAGGRTDAAVAALRRDVWGATAAAAPSPRELSLTVADGSVVAWHLGSGEMVRQTEAGRERWAGVPDVAATVDGPAVRLTVAGSPVVLPRAVALLDGGTR